MPQLKGRLKNRVIMLSAPNTLCMRNGTGPACASRFPNIYLGLCESSCPALRALTRTGLVLSFVAETSQRTSRPSNFWCCSKVETPFWIPDAILRHHQKVGFIEEPTKMIVCSLVPPLGQAKQKCTLMTHMSLASGTYT